MKPSYCQESRVIRAVVLLVTAVMVAVKLETFAPAGIVRVRGSITLEVLALSETIVPPEGAGALIVT